MMQIDILEAHQIDPSIFGDWGDYAIKLAGAGGVAMLLREVVKQAVIRANKNDDTQAVARADLRAQVADLVQRVDVLDARIEAERARSNQLFAQNAELLAENSGLRERYHRLVNWLAVQPELPTPPPWLYEPLDGPTQRTAMPQPPEKA